MVIEIPQISPEDLEKILKHLPEPTYAEVSLWGAFDYSTISRQAGEIVPGVKLQINSASATLKDPSKETILKIYRESYRLIDVLENPECIQDLSPESACTEGEKAGKKLTGGLYQQKRIGLDKIVWYFDNGSVELTPWEIDIRYMGKEPNYISEMRQELAGTSVRLTIKVNQ